MSKLAGDLRLLELATARAAEGTIPEGCEKDDTCVCWSKGEPTAADTKEASPHRTAKRQLRERLAGAAADEDSCEPYIPRGRDSSIPKNPGRMCRLANARSPSRGRRRPLPSVGQYWDQNLTPFRSIPLPPNPLITRADSTSLVDAPSLDVTLFRRDSVEDLKYTPTPEPVARSRLPEALYIPSKTSDHRVLKSTEMFNSLAELPPLNEPEARQLGSMDFEYFTPSPQAARVRRDTQPASRLDPIHLASNFLSGLSLETEEEEGHRLAVASLKSRIMKSAGQREKVPALFGLSGELNLDDHWQTVGSRPASTLRSRAASASSGDTNQLRATSIGRTSAGDQLDFATKETDMIAQDPLATRILEKIMERQSCSSELTEQVESIGHVESGSEIVRKSRRKREVTEDVGDLPADLIHSQSPKDLARADSRRSRAILARFIHKVDVCAVVRSPRGVRLLRGFVVNVANTKMAPVSASAYRERRASVPDISTIDAITLSCGPKKKTYMIDDMKLLDYSDHAIEAARQATLDHGTLTDEEWPEDICFGTEGRVAVCYFAGHSIPVIVVFESDLDRLDFVELLSVILHLRKVNTQFIWQTEL